MTFSLPAALGWTLLVGVMTLAFRGLGQSPITRFGQWVWWPGVGGVLLAFRWPLLWVPHQQNPDESQLIAGALTLWHDPMFWRSVDGGTAGPLDYYPLLPVVWGDGGASYAIARLIAIVVVFGTIVFAGATLAKIAGIALARVIVLPALAFFAFTTSPDFNHYSTELMPALLLAAAGYVAVVQWQEPSRARLWMLGLLLGAVLWTKLQAVPLAGALWLFVAGLEFRAQRPRSLLPLTAGAIIPTLVCFGAAALAGQTEHLITPFFLHNFAYVQKPQFSWFEVAAAHWGNARLDGYLAFWLAGSGVVVLVALGWLRRASNAQRGMAAIALLLLGAGVFSALGPRRPSTHHLHLIFVPLLWATGCVLAAALAGTTARRTRLLAIGAFLGVCLLPQLVWRAIGRDPFVAMNTSGVSEERRELARLVRVLSAADEPLAMWGWRCSLYVEAGRGQATRQAHTEGQIYEGPLQPYFLRRYLEDFIASNAPVFADAVGPGNFAFESPRFAHEVFAPLREHVSSHYTLVTVLDGTRLYARNDRVPRLKETLPRSAGE